MAKLSWIPSALACGCVLAAAAVIGTGAHAQTGDDAAQVVPAAKKSPPPPPLQIPGSWNGTIQDSHNGAGNLNMTFTERNTKTKGILKGTWTVNFPSTSPEGAINDLGTLTGSVVGNAVSVTLVPRRGDALGSCRTIFSSPDATQQMIAGTFHFAACSGTNTGTISLQPGAADTSTVYINVNDDFFYPIKQTINAGQTVRWTNNGREQHSVNANTGSKDCNPASIESFDSPAINTGETFDHTFNNTGTFAYHCQLHGCPMRGTITVQ